MGERSVGYGGAQRGYVAILLIAIIGMAASTWFVASLGVNTVRT